jgi:hypothetical protein
VVIVSIAFGSCFVAGLPFSVGREGRGGAIEVLMTLPLAVAVMWVMVAGAAAVDPLSVSDKHGIALVGVPIALFVAACTEVGYGAGRLLARLRDSRDASG